MSLSNSFIIAVRVRMPLSAGQDGGNNQVAVNSTSRTFVSPLGLNQRRWVTFSCTENFYAHRNPKGANSAATSSDKLFYAERDYEFELAEGETVSVISAGTDGLLDWHWSSDVLDTTPES